MSLQFLSPSWPTPPRSWQASNLAITMRYFEQPNPEPCVGSAIMAAGKSIFLCELVACTVLKPGEVIVVSTSSEDLVLELYDALRKRCGQYKSVGKWYGKGKRMAQVVVVCMQSMTSFATAMNARGLRCVFWVGDEIHRTETDKFISAYALLNPDHSFGLTATPFRSDEAESLSLFKHQIFRYGADEAMRDGVVVPMKIRHYEGESEDTDQACLEMIRASAGPGLTNASSCADANKFATFLTENGVPTKAVHNEINSRQRYKIMDELRDGKIHCVVHVNMLTEGKNFPFLMWLTLRREIEARNRFCQENGRGLRSCADLIWGKFRKTECVFNDPHDLFGQFGGISFKECLGEAPPKAELPFDILQPAESAKKISEADPPVAMAAIESAVRTIAVACVTAGIMGQRKVIKKADRLKPSNPMQRKVLTISIERAGEFIPEGWRTALHAITERPECIRFGFAADLISSLEGVRKNKRWPNLDTEGRISGMLTEDQEPTPVLKTVIDEEGQHLVDWSEYAEAKRTESLRTWTA